MSNKVERSYDGQSLLDRVTTSISFIGAVGLILIAAAIVVDVLMRWLFNAPILGVDDLSIFILAVVVSSFFPLGLAKGHFVTIRFLGKALGPRSALWLEVFGGLCTLAFFVFLAWRLFFYSVDITRTGLATIVLQLPQAPWWWYVTIVFVICIPVQVIVFINKFRSALSGPSPVREPVAKTEAERIG